jgi:hypothetical protein
VSWGGAHLFAHRRVAPLPGIRHALPAVAAAVTSLALGRLAGALAPTVVVAAYALSICLAGRTLFADLRQMAFAKRPAPAAAHPPE